MDDEITSINAIYGADTLRPLTSSTSTSDTATAAPGDSHTACILKIPTVDISLLLHFPRDYPATAPEIIRPSHTGASLRKGAAGQVVIAARAIVTRCFVPDEPCVYALLEELESEISHLDLASADAGGAVSGAAAAECSTLVEHATPRCETLADITPPAWSVSAVRTVKKSIFVARAARVSDPGVAQRYIAHLVATDRKVARATHNISAWRIRGAGGVGGFQDWDDDGEAAAGGRLLRLLQVMGVWDVVIVVSRWFGGVLLGAERFRVVGEVGREAVLGLGGG